jgi:agmatinase
MENKAAQEELLPIKFGGIDNAYSAYEKSKVAIVPVPYGRTVSYKEGTEMGPRAILEASNSLELFDDEIGKDTYRIGIYTAEEMKLQMFPPEEMISHVENKVSSLIKDSKFPFLIGGEHTVTIGAVKSLLKNFKDMSVFCLDAHHDLRDTYKDSKFSHACVNRRISEMCGITVVGTRSLSKEEKNFLTNENVNVFSVYDILDIPNWKEKIRDSLSENIYISIDLDVMDPSIMPAVGTPEPGGFGWYELLDLIRFIIQYKNVVGMDVVELCPIKNVVAPDFLAAKLIYRLIGYNFIVNNKRIPQKKEANNQ